jgi:CubicO group peptidase (beta-lactamase class C family)
MAYRGKVHDPTARRLGGLAGNAGLFSTGHDMARFASMMANGGELNGTRIFRESIVRMFTARQPGSGTRALGWDTPSAPGTGAAGAAVSPNSFGHTGFTGTSIWIDADRGTWVVLLANRTYEDGPNRMQTLRRTVHDRVADAVRPEYTGNMGG